MSAAQAKLELLTCKCKSCTHWEIGKDTIICKTCGATFPATVKVNANEKIYWEQHNR